MSKVKLTKDNIIKLLSSNAEIEFEEEQNQSAFQFDSFFEANVEKLKNMTVMSCLTFLKNRQSIMKVVKQADFTFNGITIKKSKPKIEPKDMTFRRLDAMIRAKMVEFTAKEEALEVIKAKISSHPLVMAYSLNVSDAKSARIACLLGGSLPLLASIQHYEAVCLVLAVYQDAKSQELGIDQKKYDTKEAIGKVCTVLKSKGYVMDDAQLEKAKMYAQILSKCDPKLKGDMAMNHYEAGLKQIYEIFGVSGLKKASTSKAFEI